MLEPKKVLNKTCRGRKIDMSVCLYFCLYTQKESQRRDNRMMRFLLCMHSHPGLFTGTLSYLPKCCGFPFEYLSIYWCTIFHRAAIRAMQVVLLSGAKANNSNKGAHFHLTPSGHYMESMQSSLPPAYKKPSKYSLLVGAGTIRPIMSFNPPLGYKY